MRGAGNLVAPYGWVVSRWWFSLPCGNMAKNRLSPDLQARYCIQNQPVLILA